MKLGRLCAVMLGAGLATTAGASPDADGAFPLKLEVGGSVAICATGTVVCPATVICDDLSVVTVTGDERGAVLKGAKPGSTLCSAGSSGGAGMRQVFRVTVVPSASPPK